jgi:hypothetical protein
LVVVGLLNVLRLLVETETDLNKLLDDLRRQAT